MGKLMTYRGIRIGLILLVSAFLLLPGGMLHLGADDNLPKKAAELTKLAKDLIGTWAYAGTPDEAADPPKSGGRLKFFTGKNWCITQSDPDSGKVIFHHGGTYTLDGDMYAETIEYANENTAELIKKTFKFKIKVEGDTYTQTGIGDDNPFKGEVWKRVK
ncbi:MAG TPA: hypothetical protein VH592_26770 [Gemmataceae bacterium]|jgi:hypothetical protein